MHETTTDHKLSQIRVFTEHPESVGETYTQHLFSALSFSLMMARATVCCAIHAFLPFLFTATGSRIVEELANGMNRHQHRPVLQAKQETISQL